MINVEKLGFENLDELDFAQPPVCDCGCGDVGALVVPEGEDIGDSVASILGAYDCPAVGALVVGANNECKVFLPSHMVRDCDYKPGVYSCLLAKPRNKKEKEASIQGFVEMVNDLDLHHLLILNEIEDDRGCYEFSYRKEA